MFRAHNGTHRKTIVSVSEVERTKLLGVLESSARRVLAELITEAETQKIEEGEQHGGEP
ncbi:hypothetical protein D3C71_2036580 [compost metagenome]